ncbi:MAG: V-type ATP synthase subunit D [Caldisericia bacterium]
MKLRVNPNRMVLLTLKKRLQVAIRGHKLLKDKLEGMIKEFIVNIKDFKEKSEKIDEEFLNIERLLLFSKSLLGNEKLEILSNPRVNINLNVEKKNVMGVTVPEIKFNFEGDPFNYPLEISNFEYDLLNQGFINFLKELIEYSEKLKLLEELSREIEKTRRRVNALEYVLIPSLTDTIKFIKMKLDEIERETHGRLTRIKEIIRGEIER